MQTITLIAPFEHRETIQGQINPSPHKLAFTSAESMVENPDLAMGELALIIPWSGYGSLLRSLSSSLTPLLAQGRVMVVGNYQFFSEVEDLVLEGSVTFLTSSCSPEMVRAVASELLTAQNNSTKNERAKLFGNYSAAS